MKTTGTAATRSERIAPMFRHKDMTFRCNRRAPVEEPSGAASP